MNRISKIIPKEYRGKGVWVVATILLRALLNYVGLAMMLPILLLILDPEATSLSGITARFLGEFAPASQEGFAYVVCGIVVGVIIIKSLLNLLLYRAERNYIYNLYSHLSRKLYTAYFRSGLSFIKSSNSAFLTRNVNVVCFAFVGGVLRPMATIICEATLFLLLLLSLLIYSPIAGLLALAVFLPSLMIYYLIVRHRLARYGKEENAAQRDKARTVIESFRGYAEIEVNNAFDSMLEQFDEDQPESGST